MQLEQTDIVKANLLKCIDEKVLYSKIWEACENMNNFFERNVRDSFPKTDWAKVDLCKLNEFDKAKFLFEDINSEIRSVTNNSIFTIDGLTIEECEPYIESKKDEQDEKENRMKCFAVR